jgi:TRAP-type C4-dicarboxylate transport system permease small subunit
VLLQEGQTDMIRSIYRMAEWLALLGGVVLVALTVMVVASISGRALVSVGLGPVPGDFELVEVGVAVAIFFFMPWCYIKAGHATVDLLYMHMGQGGQRVIQVISDLLMLLVWLVLVWQLGLGMLEKKEYMETTFILQMPIWWGYALCFAGGVAGCVVYVARMLTLLGLAREPEGWAVQSNAGH